MDWVARATELLWIGGLAAIPVAAAAGLLCRWPSFRPATRHALWLAVLLTLVAPLASAGFWRPNWFKSERIIGAATSLVSWWRDRGPAAPMERSAAAGAQPVWDSTARTAALTDRLTDHRRTARKTTEAAPSNPVQSSTLPGPAVALNPSAPDTIPASLQLVEWLGSLPSAASAVPAPAAAFNEPYRVSVPAPAPAASPAQSPTIRDWLSGVIQARDALAAVPPLPPAVWFGSVLMLTLVFAARCIGTARLFKNATPAPAPLQDMVRRLAKVAGLRSAPRTLVVEERVSPMIWCGVRPRLILPVALWRDLDSASQRAVVMHELSHLRRKDHRLCWLEALIGLVYWWHPVAWWARRRLRDEAEACCDAWVVSLLPGGRRAYAEALVATKSFLSMSGSSGVPGLAVMNGRTKQLARRLTMVMTQRVAPRSSLTGAALALAIAATGMLVMPGLACPPTEKEKTEQAAVKALNARASKAAARAEDAQSAQEPKAEYFGEAPALEAMRAKNGSDDAARLMEQLKSREDSLRQMEKQLNDLQRRLKDMQGRPRTRSVTPMTAQGIALMPAQPPSPPSVAAGPSVARGGRAPVAVNPYGISVGSRGQAPAAVSSYGQPGGLSQATAPAAIAQQDDARVYDLPPGKLEALTELMAREDVPVLIERQDGRILLHGTPEQHRVFEAFVKLINPDGRVSVTTPGAISTWRASPRPAMNRGQAEQLRVEIEAAARAQRDSARQAEQIRRQAERLRENLERARDKAVEQEENADEDQSSDAAGAAQQRIAALEQLLARAESAEGRLDSLDGIADGLEARLDSLVEMLDSLNERMDTIAVTEPVDEAAPAEAPAPIEVTAPAAPIVVPSTLAPSAAPADPVMPAAPSAPRP